MWPVVGVLGTSPEHNLYWSVIQTLYLVKICFEFSSTFSDYYEKSKKFDLLRIIRGATRFKIHVPNLSLNEHILSAHDTCRVVLCEKTGEIHAFHPGRADLTS